MPLFQILGDIGVRSDGEWRPITAKRQRAVFCFLALSANRAVARDVLVDALWGDNIPQRPDTALHIIVSRLRSALGPPASRLVSVKTGYRLDLASDELDYFVAQSEFIRGRSLLRDNEPGRAAAVLGLALQAWNDEVYDDLSDLPFYDNAILQIRELRASIEETRYEALLASGRHIEVLAQIPDTIATYPWHEALRQHRMVALYRSGRQVEALREFDDFRSLLVNELGVEPSKELRDLQINILDQDGALQLSKPGVTLSVPRWTSTTLPFVGRDDEEELILSQVRSVDTGGARFIVVEGEPGVGKTRLAMEIARILSDATIFVPATGNDATRSAVAGIAEGLAAASQDLEDEELLLGLGRWPDEIAAIVPAIARRFPSLAEPTVEAAIRADRVRESIVSWIITLSQRATVVLLLDDVQRAGPSLFVFLRRLFASEEHKRVVVLATAPTNTPNKSSKFEQLLDELSERDLLDRLLLTGLTEESVARLLTQLRVPDAPARAQMLHAATSGHPFFLGELLQARAWEADSVPSSVREFVRVRVRDLGPAEQLSLECASGFLTAFDAELLAEVADITEPVAAMHIDLALDAGILREAFAHSFIFVHELTRRAIVESVNAERTSSLHRRIAIALERRGAPANVLATHWNRAQGDHARLKGFACACRAGDDALRALDPDTAIRWYSLAVDTAPSPVEEAHALLALADARHQAGDAACVDSLRQAIERARSLQDSELLILCATAWSPVWASMPPLERDERIQLLEDAAAVASDEAVRARVLARLATELLYTTQRHRVDGLAKAALAAVADSPDAATKAEVSMRYFHAMWCPHTLVERQNLMEMTLAELPTDDVLNRCFALSFAASAALEAADRSLADIAFDEMLEKADAQNLPSLTLNAMTTRVTRAALNGQLDDASRIANEALSLASAQGSQRGIEGVILQLAFIAWHQGRFGELHYALERLDPDLVGPVGKRVMLARALAARGDNDGAHAQLEPVSASDLLCLPQDMLWQSTLLFAAEAAFMLDSAVLGAAVHQLLDPFRSQVAVANYVLAPIAYGVALAGAAAHRRDFDAAFEESLAVSDHLVAPVLRRRTEAAWSAAPERQSRAGEINLDLITVESEAPRALQLDC